MHKGTSQFAELSGSMPVAPVQPARGMICGLFTTVRIFDPIRGPLAPTHRARDSSRYSRSHRDTAQRHQAISVTPYRKPLEGGGVVYGNRDDVGTSCRTRRQRQHMGVGYRLGGSPRCGGGLPRLGDAVALCHELSRRTQHLDAHCHRSVTVHGFPVATGVASARSVPTRRGPVPNRTVSGCRFGTASYSTIEILTFVSFRRR